jgi:hypothetical protein
MSRLEDELREALRREDPGPQFTARVLARVAAAQRPNESWWQRMVSAFRPAKTRWAVAGALACLFLAIGGIEYREQQVRIEGEAAKERLVLALRIAGTKLNLARDKVQELNGAASRGE